MLDDVSEATGDVPSETPIDPAKAAADKRKAHDELLRIARERLSISDESETETRKAATEDLEFRAGKQWADNIKQERSLDNRPCLVVNRIPQLVNQVTNDQRQNRPAIRVHPISDGANEDTAKIIEGLIRHIQDNSHADVAYDTAYESAVTCGFGYFRVTTDYSSPGSFDQEIFIKRIRNPMSVSFDPFSQEPDGSDAAWAFISEFISTDEYKIKWPQAEPVTSLVWDALGDQQPLWMREGSVRVAEYFYREMVDQTVHLLSTGQTVSSDELEESIVAATQAGIPCHVMRTRVAKIPVIHWCKITGVDVLEETIWPGTYIPIIPVYGAEVYVNGRRHLEGIVRNAKDPQRMLNYWKSAETEAIALAPRAPFVGAEGQFEGYEQDWKTANRKNHAYLVYKPTSIAGVACPPPQRMNAEPAIQAISMAAAGAADDLKATTGVYDSAVGAQSNEISGVAIQRRAGQSQGSNFHFTDNLTRSMRHAGRILIEIMPKIYDTARTARILGEDGSQKIVTLNAPTKDESGKPAIYSMDAGKYGVTVDTGPSYATKRQEAAASMTAFTHALPETAQFCADLIAKNQDWPGAQEISERLKKLLPPQLQGDGKQPQIPPQVQAQMQQMQQMIQMLTGNLNETTKVIETKKLDLECRERIEIAKLDVEREKIQADIEINLAKMGSQASIALLQEEVAALKHESAIGHKRLELLGIGQPINAPDNFDPNQADGGNYAGVGHIGGSENITGDGSPGSAMETKP